MTEELIPIIEDALVGAIRCDVDGRQLQRFAKLDCGNWLVSIVEPIFVLQG
jgi:hypothetical protein